VHGLDICESLSPKHFESTTPATSLAEVEEAVAGCPTEALTLVRD